LEPLALRRATVVTEREQVVRDELTRSREPEAGKAGEHAALVGDLGRQDDVECRDAVAGDEQQAFVVERVELADLAAADVRGGFRHGWVPPSGRGGGHGRTWSRGWQSWRRGRRPRRASPRRGAQ